jgi:DNA-binding SARP family transcriptional activator
MEFRLLGEVQVFAAGRVLDAGTPRQQAVLAALAVDPGRAVPIETLIDRVWGDEPPAGARNVLYSHLSRIRQLLKQAAGPGDGTAARLERRHAGYVLIIDPDLVDLHRFGRLADLGRDPSHTNAERASALAEALGLWRGTPVAALPGEWAASVRESCHRRRLDAAVHWARAELRLGHQEVVISTLPDLITEYPLAEPLECLLLEGLHAAGRDAEAIDRYATVRERLAEALGSDPGPELRALYEAILRGELLSAPRPDHAVAAARSVAAPAQLPPDGYGFTGREAQLAQLNALLALASPAPDAPGTAVIVAIDGMAGVGKTALAVHWAHRAGCQNSAILSAGGGHAGAQVGLIGAGHALNRKRVRSATGSRFLRRAARRRYSAGKDRLRGDQSRSPCRRALGITPSSAASKARSAQFSFGRRICRLCRTASWWRRIKISAVFHDSSRRTAAAPRLAA